MNPPSAWAFASARGSSTTSWTDEVTTETPLSLEASSRREVTTEDEETLRTSEMDSRSPPSEVSARVRVVEVWTGPVVSEV